MLRQINWMGKYDSNIAIAQQVEKLNMLVHLQQFIVNHFYRRFILIDLKYWSGKKLQMKEQSNQVKETHVKIEPNQKHRMRKKLQCPLHGQKLRYKCEDATCSSPYLCLHPQCLEAHFHSAKLILTKIDVPRIEQKIEKAQVAIGNCETLFSSAFQMKSVIDSLTNSITALMKDISLMGKAYSDIRSQVQDTLTHVFIGKIQEALKIESKIIAQIENIKTRINIISPTNPTPPLRAQVNQFLAVNIKNYDPITAKTLFDSRKNMPSIVQFHSSLAGKSGLIFLIVCQKAVYGAYFSVSYPNLQQSFAKDSNSFIFSAEQEGTVKKYLANPDSDNHIQANKQYYISLGSSNHSQGDGLHVSSEPPSTLTIELNLPSNSYLSQVVGQYSHVQMQNINYILVFQLDSVLD